MTASADPNSSGRVDSNCDANTVSIAAKPVPPQATRRTFHRRPLPKSCIALSSPEGKKLFASAHAHGGLKSYFELIEHFLTQSEPAYCGISTLVMTLNALAVDPRVTWKGPWRWYEESMLNCCIDLELAKEKGITFPTFLCLAKCQGLMAEDKLAQDSNVGEFRDRVKEACLEAQDGVEDFATPSSSCCEDREIDNTRQYTNGGCECPMVSLTESNKMLIVSYNRGTLGQTGTGHFSPIAAYDPVSDYVLILDVARFKYGPHWVPLQLMFDAMLPHDPDTERSRGFVSFSFREGLLCCQEQLLPQSKLFESVTSAEQYKARQQYNATILSHYTCTENSIIDSDSVIGNEIEFHTVLDFWMHYGSTDIIDTRSDGVWEIIEPQLIPVNVAERDYACELLDVLKRIVESYDFVAPYINSARSCRKAFNRMLDVRPVDAMFVIYLASLPSKEARVSVVDSILKKWTKEDTPNATIIEQVLMEAELVRLAIEYSPDSIVMVDLSNKSIPSSKGCSKCSWLQS